MRRYFQILLFDILNNLLEITIKNFNELVILNSEVTSDKFNFAELLINLS